MRNLQPSQFDQRLTGMTEETGRSGSRTRFPMRGASYQAQAQAQKEPGFDPGPNYVRGTVSPGQRRWNFNPRQIAMDEAEQRSFMEHDFALEHGRGGLVPVDPARDPDYDEDMWLYGGAHRNRPGKHGQEVTREWESRPVETIGPDVEIRTGQVHVTSPDDPSGGGRLDVDVRSGTEDYIEELRHAPQFREVSKHAPVDDPRRGGKEQHPWILRMSSEEGAKNYLLEGHHRAIASRTRGTGEFKAHVFDAGDMDDFGYQFYRRG